MGLWDERDQTVYEIDVYREGTHFKVHMTSVRRREELIELFKKKFPAEEGWRVTVSQLVPRKLGGW
jgi:hypothetical protein